MDCDQKYNTHSVVVAEVLLQLMKATVLAESSCFTNFHRVLSIPASLDMSQVGVALFPSFENINHFTFAGFPFILILTDLMIKGKLSKLK